MKKTDIAYLAGLVDGKGYIGIKKSGPYKSQGRVTPGYHARIQVRMVDELAIKFMAEILGGWYYKEKAHCNNGKPLYCYQFSDLAAEKILKILLPFLRVKYEQAVTVLFLRKLQANSRKHRTKVTGSRDFPNQHGTVRKVANKCFSDEYVQQCHDLWLRCKTLNKVGV